MTGTGRSTSPAPAPELVVAADWGLAARKRQVAFARRSHDGTYVAGEPRPLGGAGAIEAFVDELLAAPSAVIGLDVPLGVPRAWADRAGVGSFPAWLASLGPPPWDLVAATAADIAPSRPFYPARPGGTSRRHLVDGLGLPDADALRRRCDRSPPLVRPATPLFWTLGAAQVGKAALHAWATVVRPLLAAGARLWPYTGPLAACLAAPGVTIVELWPTQCAHLLGLPTTGSKRSRAVRAERGERLLAALPAGVSLSSVLRDRFVDGFGHGGDGEDPFDAAVALVGLAGLVLGHWPGVEAPDDPAVTGVEGWVLGAIPGT